MMWYYAEGGRQMGPVDDAALDNLVRQGVVRDNTLVWREGMAAWQAHSTARPGAVADARPAAPPAAGPASAGAATAAAPSQSAASSSPGSPAPSPAAAASETRYCAECGRPYPAQELSTVGSVAVCASCRPAVMQRMSAPAPPSAQPYAPPPYAQPYGAVPGAAQAMMMGSPRYAGFWIRFVAILIDGIIVGIVSSIILLPLAFLGIGGAAGFGALLSRGDGDPAAALAALPSLFGLIILGSLLRFVIFIAYEAYFVSSRGATPGKMVLGLKIVRADGGPISMGLAAGRACAMLLSGFIFYIGFIMAGFDPEKRSLHDRICNTRVIYGR